MSKTLTSSIGAAMASPARATDLAQLKVLWETKFPRRAAGGWWSLSGFSLQIIAALERMLRNELIEKKPRGEVGLEEVSDAILSEDKLYLVQVKRTLTKAALAAAFTEAYDIASLCASPLEKQLRFQVVTMANDSGAVLDEELARHALRERSAIDDALLKRTLAMFAHAAPIRIVADPAQALREVLWNAGVDRPMQTMHKMLGRILGAFNGADRAGVQDALIEALDHVKDDIRATPRRVGQFYVPGDLTIIRSTTPPELRIDARPRMPALQMGQFIDRPLLLRPAVAVATKWAARLDQHVAAQRAALPVFCIRGRSGDGKSVLLLQLAGALVESRAIASITGLAGFDDLKAWLETRDIIKPGDVPRSVEFAFVDNLATLSERAVLDELIDHTYYFGSRPAAVLTCGVPEETKTTPHLDYVYFDLPRPTRDELIEFSKRLGLGTQVRFDTDRSFAAMLADLQRGAPNEMPLGEQLRQALDSRGVWPAARHVVAANLLGVPAVVAPADAPTFDHFEFVGAGRSLRAQLRDGGYELGHAEFLTPIYQGWLSAAELPQHWGTDLGESIALALQRGEPRLARALLGAMVDVRKMRARLRALGHDKPQSVATLLSAALDQLLKRVDDLAMAPVMRQWLVAQRATKPPDSAKLLARAATLLDNAAVAALHKAEIALQLAHGSPVGPANAARRARAFALLETIGDVSVVIDHYTRIASSDQADHQAQVRSWLDRHHRSPRIAPALTAALRAGEPQLAHYRKIGFKLVGANPDATALSGLVRALALEPIESAHERSLDKWLAQAPATSAMPTIWLQLLHVSGGRRYLDRAIDWLSRHVIAPDTHSLLARIVAMDQAQHVEPIVSAWLDAHRVATERYPVIGAMLGHAGHAQAGLRLALEHLATDTGRELGYLTAQAIPVVKAMTAPQIHALTQSLPRHLHKPLARLIAQTKGKRR
ncbi:MAG: hypothetical protein ACTHM8_03180 [Sphingomonas sp.]